MKYFTDILRGLSSQKHLYFLFGFLFIIPNCVFLFTEPLPVSVSLASIIMPLAFWMGILLLARKPGVVVWFLLPKIILDGGQLVLLYLFGESVIAVDMFLNLTSSNASEASELLGHIFLVIICVFFFYTFPTLWLATRSIRMKDRLAEQFRKKWALRSLGLFGVGVLCLLPSWQEHSFSLKNDVYPVNALYNLYFAITKSNKNANYSVSSADFKFNSVCMGRADGKRQIYVLVVGETSRAMEWSLYGYERNTTPRMRELDGLVHFTDVVTQSNNTHKSVPIILSAASAEDYGVIYDEKSIVSAFKEAGFRTLVIANQKLTTSMIGAFYREADTFIDMSTFNNTGSYLTSLHDAALLPYLEKELDESDDNMFVVLHTYGSHFNYYERYPAEFRIYTPDKAEGIRQSYKKELRNSYDNSIRYTDYVLGEIVDMLKKKNACSSMLYLSDHGEDIFDDSRARYLHASPIPTYYQLHIPYIIWFSDDYRRTFPEKYRTAMSHSAYPVSTNSVFHTVLDIAGVRTSVSDSTLALTDQAFAIRDRMYLGDHDEPVPFWKVGLKNADFVMLDKWKMNYKKNE